jgi:ribosomal-protein-alanine N-acetyltransferase
MTSPSWVISSLSEDDLDEVYRIDCQSPSPWTPAQLEGEFFGPPGWRLAGRENDDGPLRGFLLARNLAGEAEIMRIGVESQFRRKGLATLLLQNFLRVLANEGVCTCHLELRASNNKARKLYEKSDFVMTGLRKKYYTDPADDAMIMTRTV